jgi:hypothetical protein
MITIIFTQCDRDLIPDAFSRFVSSMPIIPRCELYESALIARAPENPTFTTHDEHMLLVAQWLHAQGTIQARFVSQCRHSPKRTAIALDTDGSMLADPHHGFYGQRLKYLI